MNIDDHVDNLNDLVLELTKDQDDLASKIIENYCDHNDLDPYGFDVLWVQEAYIVVIAE